MSNLVAIDQGGLSSVTSSPGSKRKRELESPGAQCVKRSVPPVAMTTVTSASIENVIDATHAAAANGFYIANFEALQQAAAADHEWSFKCGQHSQAALGVCPALYVPSFTEQQFAAQVTTDGEPYHHDTSFNREIPQPDVMDPPALGHQPSPNGVYSHSRRYPTSSATPKFKLTVGSEEWHKMRKDNHKEGRLNAVHRIVKAQNIFNKFQVERRRRDTINEGINELAKIVPGCEKTRGSILQRAVSFISQLKRNERQYIEKRTLEKLLTEQAITELSASNNKLKLECERLCRELETWKRVPQSASLEPPQEPKGKPDTGAIPI